MKKALLAIAVAFVATTASAAITGSSHDMTLYSGAGNGARCAYCHMPHNGAAVAGAPLWARNVNYAVTYTPYSSVFGGQVGPTGSSQYNAGTRMCLSCHDGTQFIAQVFAAAPAGSTQIIGGGTVKMTGNALVGPNLVNDHPVSITYTTNGANGNIGGLIASPISVYNIGQGRMLECTNCHNAHNGKTATVQYPNRYFMVSVGSADFCSGCHGVK